MHYKPFSLQADPVLYCNSGIYLANIEPFANCGIAHQAFERYEEFIIRQLCCWERLRTKFDVWICWFRTPLLSLVLLYTFCVNAIVTIEQNTILYKILNSQSHHEPILVLFLFQCSFCWYYSQFYFRKFSYKIA